MQHNRIQQALLRLPLSKTSLLLTVCYMSKSVFTLVRVSHATRPVVSLALIGALLVQPLGAQAALASRTVSWNPVNFSEAAAEWLSASAEADKSKSSIDAGRNSQADFAPGTLFAFLQK